ncbi:MAG: hypothetical protein ACOH2D_14680 [Gelidibacter sp.]
MKTRYLLVVIAFAMFGISCSPDAIDHDSSMPSDSYATGGEHSVYPDNVRD